MIYYKYRMEVFNVKIGEFLDSKMKEKGISQAELSRRSGVPASTISSLINRNNERVAIESLLKLCEVIGCDINEYIDTLRTAVPKELQPYKMPDGGRENYRSKKPPRSDTYDIIEGLNEEDYKELKMFIEFLLYRRDRSKKL